MTVKAMPWFVAASVLGCVTAPALGQNQLEANLQARVNAAIEKGVAYLKKLPADLPRDKTHELGRQALVAWTLLECGVPPKDDIIQRHAESIREGILNQELTNANYGLATALIFLDKLADPSDAPLIESTAARLLAAQTPGGGWTYTVPPLLPAERDRLRKVLEERRAHVAAGVELKDKKMTPEQWRKELPRYIRQAIFFPPGYNPGTDDNSNTQFTMMALWVARRHDLPVADALARTGKRFRATQSAAGAWTYTPPVFGPGGRAMPGIIMDTYPHPAMTCVGLIGLALEKGVQQKTKELRDDAQVKLAFQYLGKHLDRLAGNQPGPINPGDPANPAAPAVPPNVGGLVQAHTDNYFYFLFSVERAAVLYDIEKIGNTEWYAFGAEDLVRRQAQGGHWHGRFEAWNADTCFALLFLKRANVAHDLTDLVKGIDRRPDRRPTPAPDRRPKNDPLLDLPLIIPKSEKQEKAAPPQAGPEESSLAPSPWRRLLGEEGPQSLLALISQARGSAALGRFLDRDRLA